MRAHRGGGKSEASRRARRATLARSRRGDDERIRQVTMDRSHRFRRAVGVARGGFSVRRCALRCGDVGGRE